MAIIWRTPLDEKIYVTPSGYPLTKEAHLLADKFDIILKKKLKKLVKQLIEEEYCKLENPRARVYVLDFIKQIKKRF